MKRLIVAALLVASTAHAQGVDVPCLIKLIENQPSDMDRSTWKEKRRDAARKIVQSKDKRGVPVLIKLVETETFDIIGEIAIEGLGNLGDASAVPTLQKIANDNAREKSQRELAKKALAKLGVPYDPAATGGTGGTGTGGTGTYTVSVSQTVASGAMGADNGGTVIVASDGGRWKLADTKMLSLRQFGAKGDGATNDYPAVSAWTAEILNSGKKGYAPAGRYKLTSAWVIDFAACSSLGLTIEGDGMQRTIFDLTSVTSGVPFQVEDSNGATGGDTFYVSMSDFGVLTNINGTAAALGKNDLSDALNACIFGPLYFANASTGASACALEINGVYQSQLNVTANCSGSSANGDSVRVRQMQFSTLTGSGGNGTNSLHFTGGYSFGNTILNFDAEEVAKCVLIDVSTASSNTFIGGQLSWSVAGIDATAGSNNIFVNPNFGSGGTKVLGSTGIAVIGDGKGYGTLVLPNTTVRAPVGDAVNSIDAIAGQQASEIFLRANSKRWMLRMDNSSESGSNAGSNIVLTRFSDTGVNLGDVWYVTRSNGQMTINNVTLAQVGFFGTGPVATKPTVSGSRSSGAALTSLLGALSSLGLINDTTTA